MANIFAEHDGKAYIKLIALMNPLIAIFDGLPVTFFGKGKTAYLDVDTAIKWCSSELKYRDRKNLQMKISVMMKAKKQIKAEG